MGPHNDLRSNSCAGWFIRLRGRHRAEKLELLKLPNEEREGALKQTCCGCVGLEIDKKLICHTERYDPVVFTAEALHRVKLHQPDKEVVPTLHGRD